MLRLSVAVGCLIAMLAEATPAFAGPPRSRSTTRFPRVYGFTGRPYGPTQAHYQYRRQYGRPWHGYGGINTSYRFASPYGYARHHHNHYHGLRGYGYSRSYLGVPFYGLGYGYYGAGLYNSILYGSRIGYGYGYGYPRVARYATYGPVFNYSTVAPVIAPRRAAPAAFDNAAVRNALQRRGVPANPIRRPITVTVKRTTPSSLKAKRHSIRLRQEGDEFLRKQDYKRAASRYHSAVLLAGDLAAGHFRLGYARAGEGDFAQAVASFKRGLQIDPQWPTDGRQLGEVFGRDNDEATARIVGKATDWTKADIRNPDRLFLLGVFLHFANRGDKARLLFEAAQRLGGRGDHLTAFLEPIGVAKPQADDPRPKLVVPPLPER